MSDSLKHLEKARIILQQPLGSLSLLPPGSLPSAPGSTHAHWEGHGQQRPLTWGKSGLGRHQRVEGWAATGTFLHLTLASLLPRCQPRSARGLGASNKKTSEQGSLGPYPMASGQSLARI